MAGFNNAGLSPQRGWTDYFRKNWLPERAGGYTPKQLEVWEERSISNSLKNNTLSSSSSAQLLRDQLEQKTFQKNKVLENDLVLNISSKIAQTAELATEGYLIIQAAFELYNGNIPDIMSCLMTGQALIDISNKTAAYLPANNVTKIGRAHV